MAVVAFWISSVAAPALQQRRVHKALRLLFAVRDPRWIPPPNASSSAETQSYVANDELLTATLTQYWTSSHTDRRRRGRLARSDAHHFVRSPTTAERTNLEFGAGASLPGSYETWTRDGSGTRSWAISPCRFL